MNLKKWITVLSFCGVCYLYLMLLAPVSVQGAGKPFTVQFFWVRESNPLNSALSGIGLKKKKCMLLMSFSEELASLFWANPWSISMVDVWPREFAIPRQWLQAKRCYLDQIRRTAVEGCEQFAMRKWCVYGRQIHERKKYLLITVNHWRITQFFPDSLSPNVKHPPRNHSLGGKLHFSGCLVLRELDENWNAQVVGGVEMVLSKNGYHLSQIHWLNINFPMNNGEDWRYFLVFRHTQILKAAVV